MLGNLRFGTKPSQGFAIGSSPRDIVAGIRKLGLSGPSTVSSTVF